MMNLKDIIEKVNSCNGNHAKIMEIIDNENDARYYDRIKAGFSDIIMTPVYKGVAYNEKNNTVTDDDKKISFSRAYYDILLTVHGETVGKEKYKDKGQIYNKKVENIRGFLNDITDEKDFNLTGVQLHNLTEDLNYFITEEGLNIPLKSFEMNGDFTIKEIKGETPARVQNKHTKKVMIDRARAKKDLSGMKFGFKAYIDAVCMSLNAQYVQNQTFIKEHTTPATVTAPAPAKTGKKTPAQK